MYFAPEQFEVGFTNLAHTSKELMWLAMTILVSIVFVGGLRFENVVVGFVSR